MRENFEKNSISWNVFVYNTNKLLIIVYIVKNIRYLCAWDILYVYDVPFVKIFLKPKQSPPLKGTTIRPINNKPRGRTSCPYVVVVLNIL